MDQLLALGPTLLTWAALAFLSFGLRGDRPLSWRWLTGGASLVAVASGWLVILTIAADLGGAIAFYMSNGKEWCMAGTGPPTISCGPWSLSSKLGDLVPDYVNDLRQPQSVWGWLYRVQNDRYTLGYVMWVDRSGYTICMYSPAAAVWNCRDNPVEVFPLGPTPGPQAGNQPSALPHLSLEAQ